jgi:hypothetical protein
VIAARFLALLRAIGVDADVISRIDVALEADPRLVEVIRWRVDELDLRELADSVRAAVALAEAGLRVRPIEPRCAAAVVNGVASRQLGRAIVKVIS